MRTYTTDVRHVDVINKLAKEDLNVDVYVVMCLDSEKLQDLCELYPRTA